MSGNPFIGVGLHAAGGVAHGSFYVPLKKVRAWAWESACYPLCDDEVQALVKELWGTQDVPKTVTQRRYGKGFIHWGGELSPPAPTLQHDSISGSEWKEWDAVQAHMEKLDRSWKKDRDHLAPPAFGDLAELDPALIVTPAAGPGGGRRPHRHPTGSEIEPASHPPQEI